MQCPTDYQLYLKGIIIILILIKQKSYLQLVRKLVQAEEFYIYAVFRLWIYQEIVV